MLIELSNGKREAERKSLREQEEKFRQDDQWMLLEKRLSDKSEYFEENDDEQQTIAYLTEK